MRQIANGTHIKTDKNPLAHGVLGSYEILQDNRAKAVELIAGEQKFHFLSESPY
jgi:hypothetical protein